MTNEPSSVPVPFLDDPDVLPTLIGSLAVASLDDSAQWEWDVKASPDVDITS